MRIATHTTSETILAQLQRLGTQQANLQNQVATGQRLFQPGDDPAAVGRVLSSQIEQRSLAQFTRNADAALAYSKTSYSGIEQIKKLSDRAGEIAILGTGTSGPQAMQAYAAEIDQLIEQAVSVGNTRFGNDHVFAGTALDTAPFTPARDASGRIATVAYAGDTGRLTIPLADGATLQPTPSADTNAGLATFMNQLVALRDALRSGDTAAVQTLREPLTASEDTLVTALGEHGAIQLRIEISQTQQKARLNELDRQISSEADADLPATIVRLNQTTQAYEAALASASKTLNLSLLDYLR